MNPRKNDTMKSISRFTALAACVGGLSLAPAVALDDDKEHKHDKEHQHEHAEKKAGPNGGRLITSVEPHVEFLVMKDRKVQITFVDEDNKKVAPGKQKLRVTAGDRKKPTKLTFEQKDGVLVSDKSLPAGDDYPVILQIKPAKLKKSVLERFVLDMSKCGSCEYLEYACTCDHHHHDHDHDHDHDHKAEKKGKK